MDFTPEQYAARKASGVCICCSAPAESGCTRCFNHGFKKIYRERKVAGLCVRCGVLPQSDKLRCDKCKTYQKMRYADAKRVVFDHYGRTCQCCKYGFPDEFLTIDHVNNDGKEHRQLTGSPNIYPWLLKKKFLVDVLLQTLCWNCNGAKAMNHGVCPHQTKYQHLINSAVSHA